MEFYLDLPEELQPLFPIEEFPMLAEAIRRLIADGYQAMKPTYQRLYAHGIHDRKGHNRILYASNEAVKALIERPPKDSLQF